MIIVDGIEVKGGIYPDRSKKDITASGKVRWHRRYEAEACYYGVSFRKRGKWIAQLEDFLLNLHLLDEQGLMRGIAEECKRQDAHKRHWTLNSIPASARAALVEHSTPSKKESFAINQ